jgi:uncharacterized protein
MLRASNYNIYVNLPNNSEEMLLVHGYTGAYDKVSRQVANYLRSLQAHRRHKPLYGEWGTETPIKKEFPSPSEQTISALKRRGYLTEKSPEEEEATFTKLAKVLHAQRRRPNYIFMPTYDCNLRCPYCFQDHMRNDPAFSHLLRSMTRELVDRIFVAIPKMEARHGIAEGKEFHRSIGFFGGEPLLKESRPIVEYIINKALLLGKASFYAITNGTNLHFYKDLLGPDKISYIQITLDGPAREHDRRRIYPDGSGSFEIIARNITLALDQGIQVNVRMNIDRNNANQLPELADEMISRGWDKYKNFLAYTAPIHPANKNVDITTTFNSWELDQAVSELRRQYPDMRVISRPDDPMKNNARRLFRKNGAPALKSTFCGAHNGMYIFDAFGDIYACWELTGDKKVRIGSITSAGHELALWNIGQPSPVVVEKEADFALEESLTEMWRSRNVTTNPTCLKCRYAFHCGGGCAVLAERKSGTMFTNFCDAFGKRFNAMVAEAYLEHISGAEYEEKADRACDL